RNRGQRRRGAAESAPRRRRRVYVGCAAAAIPLLPDAGEPGHLATVRGALVFACLTFALAACATPTPPPTPVPTVAPTLVPAAPPTAAPGARPTFAPAAPGIVAPSAPGALAQPTVDPTASSDAAVQDAFLTNIDDVISEAYDLSVTPC